MAFKKSHIVPGKEAVALTKRKPGGQTQKLYVKNSDYVPNSIS